MVILQRVTHSLKAYFKNGDEILNLMIDVGCVYYIIFVLKSGDFTTGEMYSVGTWLYVLLELSKAYTFSVITGFFLYLYFGIGFFFSLILLSLVDFLLFILNAIFK